MLNSEGVSVPAGALNERRQSASGWDWVLSYLPVALAITGLAGVSLGVASTLGMSEQVQRARTEVVALETSAKDLMGKVAELKAEVEVAQSQRDTAAEKERLSLAELDRTHGALEKLQVEAAVARSEIAEAAAVSRDLPALRQQVAELDSRRVQLEAESDAARKAIADAESEVIDLLKRASALASQVAAAESTARQAAEGQEALRTAQADLKVVSEQRIAVQAALAAAEQRRDAIAEQVAVLEAKATQLAEIQTALEASTRRAGAVEAEIKQLEPRVIEARELAARRDALETELKRLEAKKVQVESAVGSMESMRKVADQLDKVLLQVVQSLKRAEEAARGSAATEGTTDAKGTQP